jgi:hypothetical protein
LKLKILLSRRNLIQNSDLNNSALEKIKMTHRLNDNQTQRVTMSG